MQISVKEAARLLAVSEKTIYRWIRSGDIPSYRINDLYRFSRAELLEWATARRIAVSPDIFAESAGPGPLPGLADAISAGGIHYRVSGGNKQDVLASIVDLMRLPEEVDRKFLLNVILARESLGSTGFGGGIAIPHVRNPIVLHIPRPMITLCFLDTPVEFGAIDGQPVHTLFTLVSPTVQAHLHLLSRLTYGLRKPEFSDAVAQQSSREALLAAARAVDQSARPAEKAAAG
ncbi:MAG TPA: PTS sugar transporter subunit IIA [Spirochaetia bacterium]|nr:PTS sugar transporter subunit IIA [Spirochaetia bacterium]